MSRKKTKTRRKGSRGRTEGKSVLKTRGGGAAGGQEVDAPGRGGDALADGFVAGFFEFFSRALPSRQSRLRGHSVDSEKRMRPSARSNVLPFSSASRRDLQRHTDARAVVSLTGTDVLNWAWRRCPYEQRLEFVGNVDKVAPSLSQRLLMDRGILKEAAYVAELQRKHGRDAVAIIKRDRHDNAAFIRQQRDTIEALHRGVPYVVHALFQGTSLNGAEAGAARTPFAPLYRGEPDVLVRVPVPRGQKSRLGQWGYEPLDVKSSRRVKAHQAAQVAYYSLLLGEEQGYVPSRGGVVVWPEVPDQSEAFREEWFELAPHQDAVRQYLNHDLPTHSTEDKPFYHLVSGCESCGFHEHCEERAIAEADLSLLPGLRRDHKRVLLGVGVRDLHALAGNTEETISSLMANAGKVPHSFLKHRRQAIAMLSGSALRGELSVSESLRQHTAPAMHEYIGPAFRGARAFLDFETDPHRRLAYMAGLQVERVGQVDGEPLWDDRTRLMAQIESMCTPYGHALPPEHFLATDRNEERAAFARLLDRLDALREQHGQLQVVHFGAFERSTLRQLAERHSSVPHAASRVGQIETESVDLHRVIRSAFVLPVDSYGLKSVAPALLHITGGKHGHRWRSPATYGALAPLLCDLGYSEDDTKSAWEILQRAAQGEKRDISELLGASADMSVYWHNQFAVSGHPVWRDLIRIYNQDDLMATRAVAHWLIDEVAREVASAAAR
jgi:predicted RecB family nuclease